MIGKNLKALRKQMHLTQEELGQKLKVSRDVINNIERERVNVADSYVQLICVTFNLNERWLRTGQGEMFCNNVQSSIDVLYSQYRFGAVERHILESYCNLSESKRLAISEFLDELFAHPPTGTQDTEQPTGKMQDAHSKLANLQSTITPADLTLAARNGDENSELDDVPTIIEKDGIDISKLGD